MKFSIIVPIYNVKDYLARCVDSILDQSFDDYEAILVDDGSTDGSSALCEKYLKQDRHIKVVHKANGGLVSARKAGLGVAKGEYIINVDGDDYIHDKNYLSCINRELIKHPDLDIISCGYKKCQGKLTFDVFPNVDEGLYENEQLSIIKNVFLYDINRKGMVCNSIPLSIWTKIVKRTLYSKCQFRVPDSVSKGEDVLLNLFLLEECCSYYVIRYAAYSYRVSDNSMIHSIDKKDYLLLEQLVKYMHDNLSGTHTNSINVYCLSRINQIISIHADKITFGDFKKEMHALTNMMVFDCAKRAKIYHHSLNSFVKYFLLIQKCWFLLYHINKAFIRINKG